MSITRIKVTEGNEKQIVDYLALNHPTYRILKQDEYQFEVNGSKFRNEMQMVPGKKVTVSLETQEGIDLTFPLELLRKPCTSVIPVFMTEDGDMDLEFIFQDAKKEKQQFLGNSEKVHSFQNFEIRNGKVVLRTNNKFMNEGSLIIIKA